MGYQEGMDNLEEYPVAVRIRILAAQVNAAANLSTWCFVKGGELFYSTCVQEKEFLAFLKLGNCLQFLNGKKEGWNCPVIASDPLGMVWMAEHAYENGHPGMLIIIGPLFLSKTSVKYIEDSLRDRISSVYLRRQMMRTMANVPVLSAAALNQYGKMLHFTLTSERIRVSEFIYQTDKGGEKSIIEDIEDEATYHDSNGIARRERLLLQAVANGDINYKEIPEMEWTYSSSFISDTGNSLRDGKNSVLVFTALCSRASMEGGVPARTAKEIEMRYFSEIEKCSTLTKLRTIMDKMMEEFILKVRETKNNSMISKTTQESCDYIKANVTRPLSVQEIAKEMGYTTYYFTKKFNKEMGIKVTDYIKQARIEYAKIMLLTTRKSIQDISDSLCFGTRNYFSKVFHEFVGMTPAAYREKVGKGK